MLFFALEWAALEDDAAEALLADAALDHWRHHLRGQRKYRPYLLSEPEEKIVTEKTVSGVAAWSRLYEEQLGAMRVPLDGEDHSLETAMARLYEHDRDIRRGAAEAITEALGPGLRTRTYVFNTILQDKAIDDRLRGYPTWISSRNLSNETTDEAVEALIAATTSRYDVAQRLPTTTGSPPSPRTPRRRRGTRRSVSSWRRTASSPTRRARSSHGSSTSPGSTRRSGATSARAPSAPRPCPASTRTSS